MDAHPSLCRNIPAGAEGLRFQTSDFRIRLQTDSDFRLLTQTSD